ncbi:MAG: proline dehydrogenase family protein [Anaerolineae bacterium]|nr:proline dehydrogenase family protein [Anaerolineae bacterium]
MMRSLLLFLSTAKLARRVFMAMPFSGRLVRRFVAGESLDEAIAVTQALNAKGLLVTLDHLGENVFTEADANKATQAYLDLLDRIAVSKVNANASLKLTQLGLDVSEEVCLQNMRRILSKAKEHGNFVRIDMESTAYTERTLRLYRTLRDEYDFRNVGVVIQAYLRRSESDVRQLAAEGTNIRLCKGAYMEPPELAFPEKFEVDANYVRLMQIYLDQPALNSGAYIGAATHDDKMIAATQQTATERAIPKERFEFQMLYGIRPQRQQQIVNEGYKMRVYVPYGTEWYPYFMRRLAERPANVGFLLKNLLRD